MKALSWQTMLQKDPKMIETMAVLLISQRLPGFSHGKTILPSGYVKIAMENHHFSWVKPL